MLRLISRSLLALAFLFLAAAAWIIFLHHPTFGVFLGAWAVFIVSCGFAGLVVTSAAIHYTRKSP